jgi:hypothetical protein
VKIFAVIIATKIAVIIPFPPVQAFGMTPPIFSPLSVKTNEFVTIKNETKDNMALLNPSCFSFLA